MSIENNLLRANDLLGRGKLNDALLAVRTCCAPPRATPPAHHLQARLLWSLGRKQDALGAAHAAQQLDPQSAGIAAQLGEFYVELRLPEFALPLLQGAVARAPAQHEANLMLGRCYMEMDKGYRALPHFETALETATSAAQKRRRNTSTGRMPLCHQQIGKGGCPAG